MGKRARLIAARTAFEAMLEAGGNQQQLIASLAVLERKEGPIHSACVGLVEAGNPQKVIVVLEKQGAVPPPPEEEIAQASGLGAAKGLACASLFVWAAIAAGLWLAFPGVRLAVVGLALGWVVSLTALRSGAAVAQEIDDRYSTLDHLGALVFLLVLVPIGMIWTFARAVMVNAGRIDGTGVGAQPGGGYSHWEEGQIGRAGKPIALALVAVALGYPAGLAAIIVHAIDFG